MSVAIKFENISKKYVIGHLRSGSYLTLRDALSQKVKDAGNRLLHPFLSSSGQPFMGLSTTEEFWALKDLTFEVKQGDRVGIIGRNGAGKSTLLKILSRITEPTEGRVKLRGRVASLLEVGTGFHPELTGRENIFLNGAILGMSKGEIRKKFDEIVAFAEVEKFLDTPVKRYSSGMYVRLAFAVAAHLEPEILVVDEVLAVGDAAFQKKCLGKMEAVGREGRTILFVSHNMWAIKKLCSRALVLQEGRAVFEGDVVSAISKYHDRKDVNRDTVSWPKERAPKISSGSLVEVGVLNDGKKVGTEVSAELPIQIYFNFEVEKENSKIGTTVQLYNADGEMVFSSMSNHEPNWHMKGRPKGRYMSICEIPPNLLAEGAYYLTLVFWEGFYESGVTERDVLKFFVHEHGLVRGDYPNPMTSGMIRPLLDWVSFPIE